MKNAYTRNAFTLTFLGPAYAVTGGESKKSRTAIAALSRALEDTDRVGFCRAVRMRNGEPRVGALLSALNGCDDAGFSPDTLGEGGRYLIFQELPYVDDLQRPPELSVHLDSCGDLADERTCDDLINALVLPHGDLLAGRVPFPALQAYHRMIAHLAVHPLMEADAGGEEEEKILKAASAKPLCDFDVVKALSKNAAPEIEAFNRCFSLVEHQPEDDKKKRFWGHGL